MFFKAKLHEESKTGFKIINFRPYPVLFFSKNYFRHQKLVVLARLSAFFQNLKFEIIFK